MMPASGMCTGIYRASFRTTETRSLEVFASVRRHIKYLSFILTVYTDMLHRGQMSKASSKQDCAAHLEKSTVSSATGDNLQQRRTSKNVSNTLVQRTMLYLD